MSSSGSGVGASDPHGVLEERSKLQELRSHLGPLKTESKPFDPLEPIKVTRLHSSIAAGGSGDFHTLRKARTSEKQRQEAMDKEWDDRVAQYQFARRREERLQEAEAEREIKHDQRVAKKNRRDAAREREKAAKVQPAIANDGSFLAVMEAKERIRRLLALQSDADAEKDAADGAPPADSKDGERSSAPASALATGTVDAATNATVASPNVAKESAAPGAASESSAVAETSSGEASSSSSSSSSSGCSSSSNCGAAVAEKAAAAE
jgi:hypothetical protein